MKNSCVKLFLYLLLSGLLLFWGSQIIWWVQTPRSQWSWDGSTSSLFSDIFGILFLLIILFIIPSFIILYILWKTYKK